MAKQFTLPKENYASLLAAERELHDALDIIEKGEACGVECTDLRAMRDEALQRIEAIKKNFAPRMGV